MMDYVYDFSLALEYQSLEAADPKRLTLSGADP